MKSVRIGFLAAAAAGLIILAIGSARMPAGPVDGAIVAAFAGAWLLLTSLFVLGVSEFWVCEQTRADEAEKALQPYRERRMQFGAFLEAMRAGRAALAYVRARELATLLYGDEVGKEKFPPANDWIAEAAELGKASRGELLTPAEQSAIQAAGDQWGRAMGRGGVRPCENIGHVAANGGIDYRAGATGEGSGPGRGPDGYITMDDPRACRECMGGGEYGGDGNTCNRCHGAGIDPAPRYLLDGDRAIRWKSIAAVYSQFVDECTGNKAAGRARFMAEFLPRLSVTPAGKMFPEFKGTPIEPAINPCPECGGKTVVRDDYKQAFRCAMCGAVNPGAMVNPAIWGEFQPKPDPIPPAVEQGRAADDGMPEPAAAEVGVRIPVLSSLTMRCAVDDCPGVAAHAGHGIFRCEKCGNTYRPIPDGDRVSAETGALDKRPAPGA